MAPIPSQESLDKLNSQQVIWFSSVRPDGRPHLVPIWFIYLDGCIYVSTDPKSVKSRNIRANARVILALEDGSHPLICEGTARPVAAPLNEEIKAAFNQKYDWNLDTESQYNELIQVTPEKWLAW
ncbi:MAG: pyridoxamine 5'-phosphate oxidase family protein [Anaerolineaceae bacterium]|nr:pyridoxamine 5'-phosphate oxidase family protein [Anaerolineaceae bacterium]